MPLHRDIFWVGRQWAVTGFGIQAVDQRLKGAFDIEISRLWDDDLPQRMRALAWLKAEDFENALTVARSRFSEPPRKKDLPLVDSVLELIAPTPSEPPKPKVDPRPAEIKATPPLRVPSKAAIAPTEVPPPLIEPPKPEAKPRAAEIEAAPPLRGPPKAMIAPAEPVLPSEPPKPEAKPRLAEIEAEPPLRGPPKAMIAPVEPVLSSEPLKPEAKPRAAEIEAAPPLRGPPKAMIAPAEPVLPSEPPKPEARPRLAETEVAPPLRRLVEAATAPTETPPPLKEPPKAPITGSTAAPIAPPVMLEETKPAEIEPLGIDRLQVQPRPMELRIEHVSAKFLPRWRIRHGG